MKSINKKMIAVFVAAITVVSLTTTSLAAQQKQIQQSVSCSGEFIPDYFEENGIDTTQHIPLPMTRTVAQLNTMINTTYPNGSYYSTTGKECSSHANCTYPSSSGTTCINGCGTCIAYQASIQCHAFARYAYYVRNGKQITTGQTSTEYSITNSTISTNFTAGTMVRLKTSSGYMHSVLITANNTSSQTVSVYHANYGGRCKVVYQTISYADFISAFPKYYYYSNP